MPWKLQKITASPREGKKLRAVFIDESTGKTKHTDFGASGMDDYIHTHDTEARDRYRFRHKKDLLTKDPTRAGYLSWYILWNKETILASIKDYRTRFNM
jgi:hypothetical protein